MFWGFLGGPQPTLQWGSPKVREKRKFPPPLPLPGPGWASVAQGWLL